MVSICNRFILFKQEWLKHQKSIWSDQEIKQVALNKLWHTNFTCTYFSFCLVLSIYLILLQQWIHFQQVHQQIFERQFRAKSNLTMASKHEGAKCFIKVWAVMLFRGQKDRLLQGLWGPAVSSILLPSDTPKVFKGEIKKQDFVENSILWILQIGYFATY